MAALTAAGLLGPDASLWAAALSGAGGMVLCLLKWVFRKHNSSFLPVMLLSVSLAFLLYVANFYFNVKPYEPLAGTKAEITAACLDFPEESNGRYYYEARVEKLSGEGKEQPTSPFRIRLSSGVPLPAQPGDRITCGVLFYDFSQESPFSQRNNYLSRNIVLGAVMSDFDSYRVSAATGTPEPGTVLARLRRQFSLQLGTLLGKEEASLVSAMLLGEKKELDEETEARFRDVGCSHLLVVSGLHMTAVAGFFSLLLRRVIRKKAALHGALALIVILFMGLTGFSPSVLRSGLMYLLFLLADLLARENDSVNSLGIAVTVLCVSNPFLGGSVGFLLSVLSTLGILTLYPALYRKVEKKLPRKRLLRAPASLAASSLCLSGAVMATTLPLNFLVFGGMTLLTPLSNLLLLFPSTLLLYCAIPTALLSLFPWSLPLAQPFAFCTGLLAQFLRELAGLLAGVPGFFLPANAAVMALMTGLAVLLFLLLLWKNSRRAVWLCAAALLVLPVICGLLHTSRWQNSLTVAVADEGEDSCVVLLKNGEAAIIALSGFDTGAAAELLKRNGIRRVCSVFLPSQQAESKEALRKIYRGYQPEKLVVEKENERALRSLPKVERTIVFEGEISYEALPGITVTVSAEGAAFCFDSRSFFVELGNAAPREADVLITGRPQSRVNSSFTVLQTDGIIENNTEVFVKSGLFLPVSQHRRLYLDFFQGEEMRIRRES